MNTCVHCGNQYHNTFQVIRNGRRYHFDCFECAIQVFAPRCGNCGCRVIGHGVEADDNPDTVYCCDHCLRQAGAAGLRTASKTRSAGPQQRRGRHESEAGAAWPWREKRMPSQHNRD